MGLQMFSPSSLKVGYHETIHGNAGFWHANQRIDGWIPRQAGNGTGALPSVKLWKVENRFQPDGRRHT